MNVRLLQKAAGLAFAGLIAMTAGCSSNDDDETDDSTGSDAAVKDNGPTFADSGPGDTGVGGPDTGPRDTGPPVDDCPNGEEGCECNSTLTATATMFAQDDCQSNLLCIPWDLIAGVQAMVTGPVHSCVHGCATDGECGAGRFCRPMGFTAESGAERFCVDAVAEQDEFCGGSRTTMSFLPDPDGGFVMKQTGGVMTGCPDNVSCAIGVFNDVHPDEGICVNFCTDPADCATSPGTNYCNLLFRSTTSTAASGVCSVGALGAGAICGTTNPESAGLTRRCDNDLASPVNNDRGGCFATNLWDGAGFCAQLCGSANPCVGSDETGNFRCDIVDATDPMFGGFCQSECTNFPENCTGPGAEDLGRFCNDNGIMLGTLGLQFCMDRTGPPLESSWFDLMGAQIANQGGDCLGSPDPLAFAKCAEGFHCEGTGQGTLGLCLAGCAKSATVAGPQGGCDVLSATSTCAFTIVIGGNPSPIGFCGDTP